MAKEASANFEIPVEMREFAEKSVTQAKQAFDSFISAAQQAANTVENQAASARASTKEASELAMRFAERNVAASFEFAQRLLHAKDFKEVAELQAEYVKSQMATLTEQAKELSKQAVKIAGTPH
ncbi:MAG: phasin family protein [Rhizobiales bacterium]|nr:phasin family protein [Hyphomicrobiales bacterium]